MKKNKILLTIQRITWILCNIFWKLFVKLEVKGRQNLEKLDQGGAIFISNHAGKFDPFLLGSSIPWKVIYRINGLRLLAFFRYIKKRWYGPIIRWVGAYPVFRKSGIIEIVLSDTVKLIKQGYSLVMFPTSKMSEKFDAAEARPGIGYLAKKLDPVIAPVYLDNTYGISFFDLLFRRRKIKVIFGRPFNFSEVGSEHDSNLELAGKIMSKVEELI